MAIYKKGDAVALEVLENGDTLHLEGKVYEVETVYPRIVTVREVYETGKGFLDFISDIRFYKTFVKPDELDDF